MMIAPCTPASAAGVHGAIITDQCRKCASHALYGWCMVLSSPTSAGSAQVTPCMVGAWCYHHRPVPEVRKSRLVWLARMEKLCIHVTTRHSLEKKMHSAHVWCQCACYVFRGKCACYVAHVTSFVVSAHVTSCMIG